MFRVQDGKIVLDGKRLDLRPYLTREPVILALLSTVAVVLFAAVSELSSLYHTQQKSLGTRSYAGGAADLRQRHYAHAVNEFRTALLYSRDNYTYQLNLAEALVGLHRTEEASTYLINLWERQPENGLVNLELARIAAQKGNTEQALRYYHNAIYATWPGNQDLEMRQTRLELIEYLLKIRARVQAQSELILLAANLENDPAQQAQVGDLFVQAQDYPDALNAYSLCLRADRGNREALAGAGRAAFELGRYPTAERYLQAAVNASSSDSESAALLKTTELVLEMDPFRRRISTATRNRMVIAAFAAAGERLKSCTASTSSAPLASEQSLPDRWARMKPQINERGLGRDPDLAEDAMELVFDIERQTSAACETPTGTDRALLLIGKLHEGI